jgi:hypothetical protein
VTHEDHGDAGFRFVLTCPQIAQRDADFLERRLVGDKRSRALTYQAYWARYLSQTSAT